MKIQVMFNLLEAKSFFHFHLNFSLQTTTWISSAAVWKYRKKIQNLLMISNYPLRFYNVNIH